MAIDGGGWTLVATIHENRIGNGDTGKCTIGDKWSSEQGSNPEYPQGDATWQNRNIFGHVSSSTSQDYKNPAYFELNAKNIMVWQVPNETPLRHFSRSAYMQYRTTNNFLTNYGGNLYKLYKDYYPVVSGQYSFPTDSGPAIPVVFDRGDTISLLGHFPPNPKSQLEPGYIQVSL